MIHTYLSFEMFVLHLIKFFSFVIPKLSFWEHIWKDVFRDDTLSSARCSHLSFVLHLEWCWNPTPSKSPHTFRFMITKLQGNPHMKWFDLKTFCFQLLEMQDLQKILFFLFDFLFYFRTRVSKFSQLFLSSDLLPLRPYALIYLIGTSSNLVGLRSSFDPFWGRGYQFQSLVFKFNLLVSKFEDLNFNP